MADTVRYLMEEMIPELEDLEERGYFSRAEIKQIVKRRTDFEYLLKRRAAVKADYLKCGRHLLRGSPYAACPAVNGDIKLNTCKTLSRQCSAFPTTWACLTLLRIAVHLHKSRS